MTANRRQRSPLPGIDFQCSAISFVKALNILGRIAARTLHPKAKEPLPRSLAEVDFPNGTVLRPDEIAERLGVSVDYIYERIEEGELGAIDLAGKDTTRHYYRIPIELYRTFILRRVTK